MAPLKYRAADRRGRTPAEGKLVATISRQFGLLFIHGWGTGSTAVRDAMHEHLGAEEIPPEQITDADGKVLVGRHSHLPILLRHGLITRSERERLLVFTTVRNPFDAHVTSYGKRRLLLEGRLDRPNARITDQRRAGLQKALQPFDEWIRSRYERKGRLGRFRAPRKGQYKHTTGVDHVLRFESLEEDFQALVTRVGYQGRIDLRRVNVTEGRQREYRTYYTPRARRLVERAWRDVLEKYDYTF
jgi:hypothetical protein